MLWSAIGITVGRERPAFNDLLIVCTSSPYFGFWLHCIHCKGQQGLAPFCNSQKALWCLRVSVSLLTVLRQSVPLSSL